MIDALRRLRSPAPQRGVAELDAPIAVATAILVAIGLVAVYSSTVTGSAGQGAFGYLVRQLAHAALGLGLGAAVYRYAPLRLLRVHALPLAALCVASLALVHVPGLGVATVQGVKRWIDLGPATFQPIEVAKFAVVVYACAYCAANRDGIRSFKGFCVPLAMALGANALLLLQPDFGSAVILSGIVLAVLFMAGARLTHCLLVLAAAAAAAAAAVAVAPYRMQRLTSFADPFADPLGSGYHQTHSLMAFGNGGWLGSGLGQSVEKWSHLPEAHTDFIISVIAEETGVLGFAVVLLLYATLLFRSFEIAERAEACGRIFEALLARAIGLLLAVQAFINIGGNLALLPVKGLTLPLISYGGSSLIAWLLALALLQAIACDTQGSGASAGARREVAA
ncbi:MAG: putative lipid II flippase FtsW [Betaproteobacteria bacterium AqS2]|uniref:Probable peptidoglycan glycosyltransferase FtsW n=1 Tax=Candidatus Amphirhobacter heronislandensis TaxID=1732024 RepID=A0A930XWM6_9GAMM|nr:putative lipid II flippase FtsW [Betaproteobacteria bacterium AqS2]